MNKTKILALFLSLGVIAGCSYDSKYPLLNWKTWERNSNIGSASNTDVMAETPNLPEQSACESIGLQNLENRNVVRCYNSVQSTAEDCAQIFEKKGYVRFRDIPHKTADYDFLKVDTYPTRRWRDSEITSRW